MSWLGGGTVGDGVDWVVGNSVGTAVAAGKSIEVVRAVVVAGVAVVKTCVGLAVCLWFRYRC